MHGSFLDGRAAYRLAERVGSHPPGGGASRGTLRGSGTGPDHGPRLLRLVSCRCPGPTVGTAGLWLEGSVTARRTGTLWPQIQAAASPTPGASRGSLRRGVPERPSRVAPPPGRRATCRTGSLGLEWLSPGPVRHDEPVRRVTAVIVVRRWRGLFDRRSVGRGPWRGSPGAAPVGARPPRGGSGLSSRSGARSRPSRCRDRRPTRSGTQGVPNPVGGRTEAPPPRPLTARGTVPLAAHRPVACDVRTRSLRILCTDRAVRLSRSGSPRGAGRSVRVARASILGGARAVPCTLRGSGLGFHSIASRSQDTSQEQRFQRIASDRDYRGSRPRDSANRSSSQRGSSGSAKAGSQQACCTPGNSVSRAAGRAAATASVWAAGMAGSS